ncbi:MAG: decarboxylating 6-phosphogluconate dehydrogenase [Candidatus Nomurabacteria bacterium]|nr:decarboxylating 6-phosphogluconate dehydrogenase [Candidatus Nomurabacteria bacterium]USN87290.1 MAG: decarboxylating 6-phosphogluconate dehydrogenase [Candidatus Nomurabacteria bacterium]
MKKEIGFIGLGRMGLNMTALLVEKGYRVVGFDPNEEAQKAAKAAGVEVVENYSEMTAALPEDRVVWLMVPSKLVDSVLDELIPLLAKGDTVIDGGNSFYQDSLRRHKALVEKELNFLDCGMSGGMEGARYGASIMVGGKPEIFAEHEHIFETLAAPNGYARVGNEGAGHFVKMVHNGIEYGMMGAIAEGVTVLHEHEEEFGIDLKEVFKPYEHESIITSKLVTWLRQAYEEGQIDVVAGVVPTGETEFEMEHILTIGETKVLKAALEQRKVTREKESYLGKLVASMRNQFGGHKVVNKD